VARLVSTPSPNYDKSLTAMGCLTIAMLCWRFIIPGEKLHALLKVFREHDVQGGRDAMDHQDGPRRKKIKKDTDGEVPPFYGIEWEELDEYIYDVLRRTGLS